jgi:hypothetical protein
MKRFLQGSAKRKRAYKNMRCTEGSASKVETMTRDYYLTFQKFSFDRISFFNQLLTRVGII